MNEAAPLSDDDNYPVRTRTFNHVKLIGLRQRGTKVITDAGGRLRHVVFFAFDALDVQFTGFPHSNDRAPGIPMFVATVAPRRPRWCVKCLDLRGSHAM